MKIKGKQRDYKGVKEITQEVHALLDLRKKEMPPENMEAIINLINNLTTDHLKNLKERYTVRYGRFLSRDIKQRFKSPALETITDFFLRSGCPFS